MIERSGEMTARCDDSVIVGLVDIIQSTNHLSMSVSKTGQQFPHH